MKYVILRKDSIGRDAAVFWRPNSAGYTTDPTAAGLYDEAEARQIVGDGETSIAIPEGQLGRFEIAPASIRLSDPHNIAVLFGLPKPWEGADGAFMVRGDHPTAKRADKRIFGSVAANDFAAELKTLGFENITITPIS